MEHATHTCIHGLAAATVPRTCVVVPSFTDAQAVLPTPMWVRRVSIASAVHSHTANTAPPRVVPASPPHDLLGRREGRFRTNGRLPAVLSSSSGRGGHVGGTSLLGRPQPFLVKIPKVRVSTWTRSIVVASHNLRARRDSQANAKKRKEDETGGASTLHWTEKEGDEQAVGCCKPRGTSTTRTSTESFSIKGICSRLQWLKAADEKMWSTIEPCPSSASSWSWSSPL